MAVNRADSLINKSFSNKDKCVFISYQSNDRDAAKKIADYILAGGVDVYFDQYDTDLRIFHQTQEPKLLVQALCKGINKSSHMLVVVSPTSLNSKWIPFEIGFGYDKTKVITLCLKNIPVKGLPEYIQTTPIIRDIYDLNKQLSNWSNSSQDVLSKAERIFDHENLYNPLTSVMDSLIVDSYT